MQLVKVEYQVTGYVYGTYSVTNESGESIDGQIDFSASGSWTVRGANTAAGPDQSPLATINNASFTGPGGDVVGANLITVLFSAVPDGDTVSGLSDYITATSSTVTENPANHSLYTGTGTVNFRVGGSGASSSGFVLTADGDVLATISSSIGTFKAANVTVTYTYVPEAGTMAAAGAMVLGAGITIARRRRSKV